MTHKLQFKNLALSLVLALAMVAGALPFITQTGHAAKGFDVYIDDGISNGEVSSDKEYTSGSGETVTLTVTPDSGYKLKKLSVIQPDVLDSVSDLVDLMGDAEFATNDGESVKIDEGKFSIFHDGTKITSLDNSANLDKGNASFGNYMAHSGYDYWYFDIRGGKLREIAFRNDGDYGLDFTGTGAEC